MGYMAQGKMEGAHTNPISRLPLAPTPNWLVAKLDRQVTTGSFETMVQILNLLRAVASKGRMRE